jgi:hypothetical protein
MMIRWLAAFADIPAGRLDAALRFWAGVTASSVSAPHGDRGELVPLAAGGEDPYLWVQRVHRGDDEAGWHLDVLVEEVDAAAREAADLAPGRTAPMAWRVSQPAGPGLPGPAVSDVRGRISVLARYRSLRTSR